MRRKQTKNNGFKYANMGLVFILAVVLTAATKKPFGKIDEEVLGVWELNYRNLDTIELVKHDRFVQDAPGIQFEREGKLVKRQNVGWCGTPPITYGDFPGAWEKVSDSVIKVSHEYWRGTVEMQWKLLEAEEGKLTFTSVEVSRY